MWKDEESFLRSKGFNSCSFSVWKIMNNSRQSNAISHGCFLLRHHVTRNGCGLQWLQKGLPCVDVNNGVHKFNPSLSTLINFGEKHRTRYSLIPQFAFWPNWGTVCQSWSESRMAQTVLCHIKLWCRFIQRNCVVAGAAGRALWSRPWRICRRRRPANEGFEISHRISSPLRLVGWDQQKEAAADTVAAPVCQLQPCYKKCMRYELLGVTFLLWSGWQQIALVTAQGCCRLVRIVTWLMV